MFTRILRGQKNADPLNLSAKTYQSPVNIGEFVFVDPFQDGGARLWQAQLRPARAAWLDRTRSDSRSVCFVIKME